MAVQVELEIGGRRYTGWESVQVQKALEAVAGSFSMEVGGAERFPIQSGASCVLYADGEVLVDGFIDAARIALDNGSHTIAVSGRDRTADLVDCSAMNSPGEWYGIGLSDLVAELAEPFGVDVVDERADLGEPFAKFALQSGEGAFEAIERACRLRGVFPTSEAGAIVFSRPGSAGRAAVVLEEGVNVLATGVEVNLSGRFRSYTVRGQAPGSDLMSPEESALIAGRAEDPSVRARRTLLIVAESAVTPGVAQRRAQWEAVVRAARGSRWSARVAGWREKPGGELWRPNRLVLCRFPLCRLEAADLLVTAVKYSLTLGESGGTTAELELARRDAYLPEVPLKPEAEPTTFGADVDDEEGG